MDERVHGQNENQGHGGGRPSKTNEQRQFTGANFFELPNKRDKKPFGLVSVNNFSISSCISKLGHSHFQSKQDDGTGSFKDSGLDSLDLDLTDASSSSAATSYLSKSMSVSKNDVRKSRTKERRKHEQEQRKRIRARAKEERERERQLVLEGKVKLTKSHLQDPVLKVHRDLLEVERKASSSVSPNRKSSVRNARSPKPIRRKVSRSRKMATAAAVHFKWKEDVARKTKSEELGSVADAEACRPLASPTASSSSSRSVFGKEEEEIMEGLSDLNKTLEG